MNKYDNLIYLIICEEILKHFLRKSLSVTYVAYCRTLNYSIMDSNLSNKEVDILSRVLDKTKKIFSLSDEEAVDYLLKFLKKDKIINYERAVRLSKNIFPESFK